MIKLVKKCRRNITLIFSIAILYTLLNYRKPSPLNDQSTGFTKICRDVLEIRYSNPNQNFSWVKSAVDFIRETKTNKTFLFEEAYAILGDKGMSEFDQEYLSRFNDSNIIISHVCGQNVIFSLL